MTERLNKNLKLRPMDVQWIVNNDGDLGVKVGAQFFFLYKGESLVFHEGNEDTARPMKWRPVEKREFGECARPVRLCGENPYPARYEDGEDWQDLPLDPRPDSLARHEKAQAKRQRQIARRNKVYRAKIKVREFFHELLLKIRGESEAEWNCRMADKHGVSIQSWITGDPDEPEYFDDWAAEDALIRTMISNTDHPLTEMFRLTKGEG